MLTDIIPIMKFFQFVTIKVMMKRK